MYNIKTQGVSREINRAWECIVENTKISAEENLRQYGWKQYQL
jgi:hypothetical protein